MNPTTLPLVAALLLALPFAATAQDWKQSMKDMAKQQAQTQMETRLNLPKPAPPGAAINLKNGDKVKNPVLIQFGLKGAGVAPAGTQGDTFGHHHLLVDSPTVDLTAPLPMSSQVLHYGGGQTEVSMNLKPGTHTLQLLFADWKHQSFNPAVMSEKITITVQ